jgi:hypothetical protein
MASITSNNNETKSEVAPTRRTSTFLKDTKIDAGDKSEWAAMANNSTLEFNDSLPSEEEKEKIILLRKELGTVMTEGSLSKQPENVSDFKLLRFLRGYENSVEEAAKAYREMAKYREENNFNHLRQQLVEDYRDPNKWEKYRPIVQLISKGLRYEYGFDRKQNVVTVTDIGALDLRAIIKHNLQELYCELCLITEEYSNLRLHELTVERGRLVARHDLINVSNFGVFQWNKACYDLITTVFQGNKHYPECVVKITSCGNGNVAVLAWKVMKHFVPERTKKKLSVLGTTFINDLVQEVTFNTIPLVWGGGSVGNGSKEYGFDAAWSEECQNESINIGRRDSKTIKVGCYNRGDVVKWSWELSGYSIRVSTYFAVVTKENAKNIEGKRDGDGGETKLDNSNSEEIVELPSDLKLKSVGVNKGDEAIESTAGLQSGEFIAPESGIFAIRFDNSFSYFRSKTIVLSLNVISQVLDGNETNETNDGGGGVTF